MLYPDNIDIYKHTIDGVTVPEEVFRLKICLLFLKTLSKEFPEYESLVKDNFGNYSDEAQKIALDLFNEIEDFEF